MDLVVLRQQNNPVFAYLLTVSDSSEQSYFFRLREFCRVSFSQEDFNLCPWEKLDYVLVLQFIDHKKKQNTAYSTINTTLAVIKSAAMHAWQLGYIPHEEYTKIKLIKKLRGKKALSGRMLSVEEITDLQHKLEKINYRLAVRDLTMFMLSVGLGLRRVEVVRLNVADFDFNDSTVLVRGKGDSQRVMPLTPSTEHAVKRWLTYADADLDSPLFCNYRGERLGVLAVHRAFARIIDKTGCAEFKAHDLRRTFASTLLSCGVDVFAVQLLLGHARAETTQKYDRRNEKIKAAAVNMLPY